MTGVLNKLRVLDLSWGIAGPMTSMLMVDHGADVIKIEPPGGDPFRFQAGYKVWNRGKRSAELNLKDQADRGQLLALVKTADVLVESFSPSVTERLGIDYDTVKAINPRLIYCSITGYGREGRHRDRPAYDSLVAARTGLFWEQRGWPEGAINRMIGRADPYPDLEVPYEYVQGAPRPGPLFSASTWPSLAAFFCANTAISAALYVREKTGRGQRVETSLLRGALCVATGVWQRAKNPDAPMFDSWILGSKSPKGHFECSDGRWVHNWVPNPRFVLSASEGDTLNASPDLTVQNDPDRFGIGPEEIFVMMHYQPLMAERIRKFGAREWVDAAATAGMTLQDVRSPEEALNDPLFLEDGCVAEVDDPELGRIRQVGITYRMTASPGEVRGPAPAVGQHNDEVRAEAKRARGAPQPQAGTAPAPKAPLAGITVLDLGMAIAGPYGTQLLSDLGADVIKVNALHDVFWHAVHIAYMSNRGKRSIALNLKAEKAREALLRLVEKADVVQHNMRYDAAVRLGIDYDSLKKINPKLIYCHTRGFEKGPREPLPGNDQTGACLTGIQYEDGGMSDGGKPLWALTSMGDTGNGFLSAIGIIQALYHRERTGEGQWVDTSIVNAGLLNTSYALAYPDGRGIERPRLDGMQLGMGALNRLYECAEGWLCLVVANDEHWLRLCEALAMAELGDDRFANTEARHRHNAELGTVLEQAFKHKDAAHWFALLDGAGVPCEICDPQFSLGIHDDPELQAAGMVASFEHPVVERVDQTGLLWELSETPGVIQGRPLLVGENTREILTEVGYSEQEIDALFESGAASAYQALG